MGEPEEIFLVNLLQQRRHRPIHRLDRTSLRLAHLFDHLVSGDE